jgi:DNA-directed RNA polymerase subunit RPC12/RpoP
MKNDITIQLPRQEDFVAANKRRDKYAITRDIQAREFNEAIVTREKAEAKNRVKCEKCGREFNAGTDNTDTHTCPECA